MVLPSNTILTMFELQVNFPKVEAPKLATINRRAPTRLSLFSATSLALWPWTTCLRGASDTFTLRCQDLAFS